MSGHTPGPWRRSGLHVSALVIVPQGTETHPVADVYGEANARLIASAPDLLAALIEALPMVVEWSEISNYPPGKAKMRAAIKRINAAIAKATGAQS